MSVTTVDVLPAVVASSSVAASVVLSYPVSPAPWVASDDMHAKSLSIHKRDGDERVTSARFINQINPVHQLKMKIMRMVKMAIKVAAAFLIIWLLLGIKGLLVIAFLWYVFKRIDGLF